MADDEKTLATLRILMATCETALDTLRVADDEVDRQLVADLAAMVERTRAHLTKLTETFAKPS